MKRIAFLVCVALSLGAQTSQDSSELGTPYAGCVSSGEVGCLSSGKLTVFDSGPVFRSALNINVQTSVGPKYALSPDGIVTADGKVLVDGDGKVASPEELHTALLALGRAISLAIPTSIGTPEIVTSSLLWQMPGEPSK